MRNDLINGVKIACFVPLFLYLCAGASAATALRICILETVASITEKYITKSISAVTIDSQDKEFL